MAEVAPTEIAALWTPKWTIDRTTRIATFGSCFAQYIGQALRRRGYAWLNGEPAPSPLPSDVKHRFGYDLFSVRTGNIYTARQLLQWLQWSTGVQAAPPDVWTDNGRYYDPFRASVEPGGFRSHEELLRSRHSTLLCLRKVLEETDLLIFTLGLTECWRSRATGCEYQSAPGVIAGQFDPDLHDFHNQTFDEIISDLRSVFAIFTQIRSGIRLLLTVSPVPLTATASGRHILLANSYSKSILRGVAGEIEAAWPGCDYFPAYELLASHPFRGMFFAPNLRSVSPAGVDFVMKHFFEPSARTHLDRTSLAHASQAHPNEMDPFCDEAANELFTESDARPR